MMLTAEEDLSERAPHCLPFVDPVVGRILVGPLEMQPTSHTKASRFQLTPLFVSDTGVSSIEIMDTLARDAVSSTRDGWPNTKVEATVEDLIPLACQCHDFVFSSDDNLLWMDAADSKLQALAQLARKDLTVGGLDSQNNAATCTVAMILALNALESAIRSAVGSSADDNDAGRAPLLKAMLPQLVKMDTVERGTWTTVGVLLNCLLLPTGLNLRNMIWHGFVGGDYSLRPWLALVLILLQQLKQSQQNLKRPHSRPTSRPIPRATSPLLQNGLQLSNSNLCPQRWMEIVAYGASLRWELQTGVAREQELDRDRDRSLSFSEYIATWLLPSSHWPLWNFCLEHMILATRQEQPPTTIIAVVLTILLEHGLRLQWCDCNQRPQDKIARPGYFYVTLDGHGQRHKHDILLHPFIYHHQSQSNFKDGDDSSLGRSDSRSAAANDYQEANALLEVLGGNVFALLTDLFVSGSGGPNIRAALAHGVWDETIDLELQRMSTTTTVNCDGATLIANWDTVDVLLVAMEQAATAIAVRTHEGAARRVPLCVQQYRPMFSFTAKTIDSLFDVHQSLNRISDLSHQIFTFRENRLTEWDADSVALPPDSVAQLSVPLSFLNERAESIVSGISVDPTRSMVWTADDVLAENQTNQRLEPLGATRSLLLDIAAAASSFANSLEDALHFLSDTDRPNRSKNVSNRQRKKMRRVAGCGTFTLHVYTFATHVAILHLEYTLTPYDREQSIFTDKELKQAVERTRMVVSTVSTFITTNAQRAFTAADQYTKGAIAKKVVNMMGLPKPF